MIDDVRTKKPRGTADVQKNHKSPIINHKSPRHAGLSIIELLVSLAITAMLLTATMVAIDASFQAYAAAAETASTQTATRMVTNRLLAMMRTSTAHGPLLEDPTDIPPIVLLADGETIESYYITLLNPQGEFIRVEYRAATDELWYWRDDDGSFTFEAGETQQPIMGGVTDAKFYIHRRFDSDGVLVLERGSLDMTVVADPSATLALEGAGLPPIRVVASTMPRKLD
jgi:type II secretory pathway pseudopilin PulG